jgi:dTMP kinase
MTARGKLIAIEGIDGSGKATQAELLATALGARGVRCARFSFPRYDSSFGGLVGRFLDGDFGKLDAVDPHFSALLYAGDRFEAKEGLESALSSGQIVLADRYVGSNLAHQTARVAPAQRAEFLGWLRHLEYGIYGLPPEDLVIYLRLRPAEAQRLVGRKAARSYTRQTLDLQETDCGHLEQARQMYEVLAAERNWVTVECFDPHADAVRSPEEIHREMLAAVEPLVFARASAPSLPASIG